MSVYAEGSRGAADGPGGAGVDADALAAGRLARDITAREVAPRVADWDTAGVVDGAAAAAFTAAGLVDPELPVAARVEVAAAVGAGGLVAAVRLLGLRPDHPDLAVAAAFAGAARALVDVGIDYARQREVFGKPLARFQAQRHAFALATARADAALALARRAAAAADAGRPAGLDDAAAVVVAADAAWLAAETALQVHGGNGYSDGYPVSRMWREVVAVRSALPTAALDAALHAAAKPTP